MEAADAVVSDFAASSIIGLEIESRRGVDRSKTGVQKGEHHAIHSHQGI